MASKNKYWRGFAELEDESLIDRLGEAREFPEGTPTVEFLAEKEQLSNTQTSRRDFLKFVGFSTAAATLASCQGPVVKSIPYVIKPENVTPGVPTYYASTLMNQGDFASVLIKTREGRPIKIEANPAARYFGELTPRVQASILSLYNSQRLKQPIVDEEETDLKTADAKIIKGLQQAVATGKQIVIVTPSYPSPSFKAVLRDFQAKYPTAKQVVFDAFSHSKGLEAYRKYSGLRALPFYDLEKAKLIVSFGADFLGDWNGGGYATAYAKTRQPGADMARHIQVEANMSISGANADTRIPLQPTQVEKVLAEVYKGLTSSTSDKIASAIVKELKKAGSKALILADGSEEAIYLSHSINALVQSAALTNKTVLTKENNDADFATFVADLKAGKVGAIINWNTNFLYASADAATIKAGLKNVPLRVSANLLEDETAEAMNVLVPATHWLESWADANPITGIYTLTQPAIRPLFEQIRQFEDSLLTWMGGAKTVATSATAATTSSVTDSLKTTVADTAKATTAASILPTNTNPKTYYDYIKNYWTANILTKTTGISFNKALYNGLVETTETAVFEGGMGAGNLDAALEALSAKKAAPFELLLYTKTGIGNGNEFHNPWLQEFSDPITRTSWDNYVTMSYEDAKKLDVLNTHEMNGAMNGSYVDIKVGNVTLKSIPVLVQAGQAKGSIGLAVGYGQKNKKLAEAIGLDENQAVGINAYPAYLNANKNQPVEITKASGTHEFACIQLQNTLMGRDKIMREVSLADFINKPSEEWNEVETLETHNGKEQVSTVDLWTGFDRSTGHHFNLSIDLTACIGCGSCVISCVSENNVPVVGKHEVRVFRDMQWLRIDRYYSSKETFEKDAERASELHGLTGDDGTLSGYHQLENPSENPSVAFQPVMCQHCNQAPCETVCPVAATSHGKQGQNQMAYNRCIGTRYCANNCPYKVRRFNWFNYANNDKFDFNMNDDMGRMVLNPDVVVRSRGVMEKCSMCIQLTQLTILKAKKEGKGVDTDAFQTACSAACPTNAIVFGDVNDKKSTVYQKLQDKRQYYLLEHVGTKPNVFYQVKVRNNG